MRDPLPAGWDAARDLAVIVGRGAEGTARRWGLDPRGRLLVVLPPRAEGEPEGGEERAGGGEDLPAGALVARGPAEIFGRILGLAGRLPHHVSVRGTGDPWATQERVRAIAEEVARAVRSKRLQAHTMARSGPGWLLQAAENLPLLARFPSIDCLAGAFRGEPCVLVSPGPSLARNVHRLPELAGRALVVSGTHALGALRRVGVVPDLVVAADAGDLTRHWSGSDPAAVEAHVVATTCRAETLGLPARRRFAFAGNGDVDDWIFRALGERARLSTGGSVACSALSLAVHLGCDPIALVGQDLSFPEGRYYAEGGLDAEARVVRGEDGSFHLRKPPGSEGPGEVTDEGDVRFTRDQRLVEVPGYHGGTVASSESFQAFRLWFEAVADALGGRVRLWNCTEGGARIAGMEQRPLAELVAHCAGRRLDVGPRLDRAAAAVDLEARGRRLAAFVDGALEAFEGCLALAARCRELAGAAADDPRRLEELAAREAELVRSIRPLGFLSVFAQDEIVAAQEEARRATTVPANLAAARKLFTVVETAVHRLRGPLERAREGL